MNESDTIFVVDTNGELQSAPYRQYENEDILQSLIDKHPDLLVGGQINPDNPPRWLVVRREAGIPDSQDSSDRWSVDNLLLDQHGRPTFVEVKRSTDTRIRREVVGQMLDYAANAQAYWPKDRIRALAAENAGSVEELDTKLIEFLDSNQTGDDGQLIEGYWETVERNLRNGEIRLLFVADEIPTELRRIIEFLNEHMPLVEVLGIEIRKYEGPHLTALVPRVVGQTESARQQKAVSMSSARATEESFLEACPENTRPFFRQLIAEATERGHVISWGRVGFSVRIPLHNNKLVSLLYGYPPGVHGLSAPIFQAYLGYIDNKDAYNTARSEFLDSIAFSPRGEYTLEIALDALQTVEAATAAIPVVLDIAQRAVKPEHTENDAG